MFAVRNIRLCTKDCLCLYVCPTGASDTENSVIDKEKCIGCGACAAACPSGAISMAPDELPPQQPKAKRVVETLRALAQSKNEQENVAAALPGNLAAAMEKSNRIMAEDLLREAGYMLPQSANARALLTSLLEGGYGDAFPAKAARSLLAAIPCNEPAAGDQPEKWRCSLCGYVHEGALPQGFTCPVCTAPADVFERVEEA